MIASLVEILNSWFMKQNGSCCRVLLRLFLLELCPWSLNQWETLVFGKWVLQLQRQRHQHWHYHPLPSPLQPVFPMWRSEQKGSPLKRHSPGFLLYPEILAFAVTWFLLQPLWAPGSNFCRYLTVVSTGQQCLEILSHCEHRAAASSDPRAQNNSPFQLGPAPVGEPPWRGPLCMCVEKLRPTSVKELQNATSLSCKTDIPQVWK